jgi:hypothetical protein
MDRVHHSTNKSHLLGCNSFPAQLFRTPIRVSPLAFGLIGGDVLQKNQMLYKKIMAEKDTVEFEEVPSETLARFLANQTFYRQEYGALSVKSLLFPLPRQIFSRDLSA